MAVSEATEPPGRRAVRRWLPALLIAPVWLVLALTTLAGVVSNVSDYEVLVVRSGSMEPALATGGIIVVDRSVTELGVGDIGTFHSPGDDLVTHRVMARDGEAYVTKGDANETPDSSPRDPANVVGAVVGTLPFAGYVVAAFRQPPLFFGALTVGLGYLMVGELRVIARYVTGSRTDRNQDVVAPS